jgi:hypothetical protein
VLPQIPNLPVDQRKLLQLFKRLGDQERASLLAFAEFLGQRQESTEDDSGLGAEPLPVPRPQEESVVSAIKRLSSSYHMLDRSELLTQTSSLMTAHLIHGRSAIEVIDELEELFAGHYTEYLAGKGK